MKAVILTGGCGFIGRYIARQLIDSGYEIYALVRRDSKTEYLPQSEHCHAVVTDYEKPDVQDLCDHKYAAFLHFGWGGVSRDGTQNEVIQAHNYDCSIKMLELCESLQIPVFINAGSRAECAANLDDEDPDGALGMDEELSAYGKWKKRFYRYAVDFCKSRGIRYIHPRLFSAIGVGDHPWALINVACKNLREGKDMHMSSSCRQLWNCLSVREVARAVVCLLEQAERLPEDDNCIYNVASSPSRMLRDYLEEIRVITRSSASCYYDETVTGYASAPPVRKIHEYTDWQETISFEEQIKELLESEDQLGE